MLNSWTLECALPPMLSGRGNCSRCCVLVNKGLLAPAQCVHAGQRKPMAVYFYSLRQIVVGVPSFLRWQLQQVMGPERSW